MNLGVTAAYVSGFCLKEKKQINVTVERHPFTASAFMFFELMLEVGLE